MGIIIDLVIIGIILLGIILGYHKGLAGSLIKIISLIIALIISLILFKPLSILIIENSELDENLQSSIYNLIMHNKNMDEVDKKLFSPDDMNNLPDIVKNYIAENIQNAKNETQEVIATTISRNIAISIINLGVLIALFIISRIILLLIKGITNLITKIPVIKQFDKLGGIIYGVFEALIFIYIIFLIILLFNNFISGSEVIKSIQQSFLGNIMYNNNLLLKIFFNK